MPTIVYENIGKDWIEIISELLLESDTSYEIQNVTPYPLEYFFSSDNTEPESTGHGSVLIQNERKDFYILECSKLFVRNQKKDDNKKCRIALNKVNTDEQYYCLTKTVDLNYYFYRTDGVTSLTSNSSVGDTVLNIVSNTGFVNGEAITIYEGNYIFQSIIVSSTTTTATIISPLDYAFTTEAIIEVGTWNMAVDGSVTPQIFQLKPPLTAFYNIIQLNISMLSVSPMDDALFGSIPSLTNGVIFRLKDGYDQQIVLVVNNTGFFEYGYDVEYSTKAPSGFYGIRVRKNIPITNDNIISLYGDREFQIIIRDDLTDLTKFAMTSSGNKMVK